jgi:hypothetical protein
MGGCGYDPRMKSLAVAAGHEHGSGKDKIMRASDAGDRHEGLSLPL